ncbi:hypothetical protein QQ008_24595 [Fulvivirgaceae bacterium BMA10]|uniref:Uncharacterized protein n=1 Tax=Splendidivirga corallicola TaxID=3051826 RepID=A0ABT8KV02_9BACT|nr:hypothetical protein [Fulvivirgaceae bacterium BMA10]
MKYILIIIVSFLSNVAIAQRAEDYQTTERINQYFSFLMPSDSIYNLFEANDDTTRKPMLIFGLTHDPQVGAVLPEVEIWVNEKKLLSSDMNGYFGFITFDSTKIKFTKQGYTSFFKEYMAIETTKSSIFKADIPMIKEDIKQENTLNTTIDTTKQILNEITTSNEMIEDQTSKEQDDLPDNTILEEDTLQTGNKFSSDSLNTLSMKDIETINHAIGNLEGQLTWISYLITGFAGLALTVLLFILSRSFTNSKTLNELAKDLAVLNATLIEKDKGTEEWKKEFQKNTQDYNQSISKIQESLAKIEGKLNI